jgi:hypothetical protein
MVEEYCSDATRLRWESPSVAYALYLRDRRINIHIAALCARYPFRLNPHGDCLKERARRVRAR